MSRPSAGKRPETAPTQREPIYHAERYGSADRCPNCFIILALTTGHDCMTIKRKEVEYGESWSISDQF